MIVFYGFLALWGLLNALFAFVEPPAAIARIFKVPGIFVFLPEKWVMPAGRLFVALCCWGLLGFLLVRVGLG